jgi:hypothetical protein
MLHAAAACRYFLHSPEKNAKLGTYCNKEAQMKKFMNLAAIAVLVSGCAGIYTRMSKSDLAIQTSMSSTIWLPPSVPEKTKIFVQARNTSDNRAFGDLSRDIRRSLMSKGYLIADEPKEARFVLQANVLKATMVSRQASADSASSSAMLAGAGAGIAVGQSNNAAASIAAGLGAGLASMYFDAKTNDNYYGVQTDIRITDGEKSYTTVLTVMANKANLSAEEATAPIKTAISESLAGLF